MSFHHVALATTDLAATHEFYTAAMGFTLAKIVVNPTPEGGWAKHVFYDTARHDGEAPGMIAFWELHGEYPEFDPALSRSIGLPDWVNHLAFSAHDEEHLAAALDRWLDHGHEAVEIDHEFCRSIYTNDPNGTLVEWCLDTRPLDESDRRRALEAIFDPTPSHDGLPSGFRVHEPRTGATRPQPTADVALG
ncbi:MAG: VOC family protein [Microthrixaceae bacterium]